MKSFFLSTAFFFLLTISAFSNNLQENDGSKSSVKSGASQFIRKEPYMIFTEEKDELQILWQLYQTSACTFEWGYDLSYSLGNETTTEYNNDHQHTYILTSLEPQTIYYYRMSVNGDTILGNFRSAPEDDQQSLKFIAYGDTRSYPTHHNDVAKQILTALEEDEEAQTFIAFSGDFVNNGNSENDWDEQFFSDNYPFIRQLMTKTPYLSSMGNHEGNGTLFAKYFPYPFYAGGDYYWSFDYGPVHFTIIDQFTPYTVGTTQYNWLVNDLANSDKTWKFILLHKPGWSAGGEHENNTTVQNVIQPLCLEYGVQFVIAGHNHYYACAVVESVIHITTGGGGAPLYTPNLNYPNIVQAVEAYHFCKIEINQNNLHFTAIDDNGQIIHEFDYADLVPPTTYDNAGCLMMSNVPVTNCTGTVAPAVTIKNFGGNTLTSVEINYQVNNEQVNVFNWTGSLPYKEKEVVNLPVVGCNVLDNNNLTVYTKNPNGNQDEDTSNDTISLSFIAANNVIPDVYLFLKMDNNPEEISWELKNSAGEVFSAGGNYSQPLAFIKDTFALSQNDCYTFAIYDEGGDGLADGGYFALRENNFNLIYENHEFTGFEESVQFSVNYAINSERFDTETFNIFINPFTGNVEMSFDLEKNASVKISIFNLLGKEIFKSPEQILEKGVHVRNIDARGFISGIYLIRLKINHELFTRKVALHF